MTITAATYSFTNPWLLSEADGYRARKSVIVTSPGTGVLKSGTILKATARAAAAATAVPGNTGNPTMGTVTTTGAIKSGLWGVIFTSATAFDVYDPDGAKIGSGTAGAAFSGGGIGFTLTAGGTAAIANDRFEIAVDVNEFTYTPYNGSGTAAAILYNDIPSYGVSKDVQAVAMIRDCEVARFALIGLDAAAEAALEALGIVVCGVYEN